MMKIKKVYLKCAIIILALIFFASTISLLTVSQLTQLIVEDNPKNSIRTIAILLGWVVGSGILMRLLITMLINIPDYEENTHVG